MIKIKGLQNIETKNAEFVQLIRTRRRLEEEKIREQRLIEGGDEGESPFGDFSE